MNMWAEWQHAEIITIKEAACLLVDKDPSSYSHGTIASEASPLSRAIEGAILAEKLPVFAALEFVQNSNGEEVSRPIFDLDITPHTDLSCETTVKTVDLAQWCTAKEILHPWSERTPDLSNASKPKQHGGHGASKNPWEDCDQLRLPFYTPLRAAIRWCGLGDKEAEIIRSCNSVYVEQGQFPEYPCLFIHSESMRSAMVTGALPHGRDGAPVSAGEHVAPERRTIAHAVLKQWIRNEYPADVQKPHMAWLFDEVERTTHAAITAETYNALKAERDGLKTRLEDAEQRASEAEAKANATTETGEELDPRERKTMLRMIHALAVSAKMTGYGASTKLERKLQRMGFTDTPREGTIRKVLAEAAELQPDNPPPGNSK